MLKALSLVMALVMLWSCLATVELTPSPALDRIVATLDESAGSGSVAQHHLDDLPSQSPADAQVDPLPIVHSVDPVAVQAPLRDWRPPVDAALTSPPWLDGPHRPPAGISASA